MSADEFIASRTVAAFHGLHASEDEPEFVRQFTSEIKRSYGPAGLLDLYARFAGGDGYLDALMRNVIWRAAANGCGAGLRVGSGAVFRHLHTVNLGNGVFIGAQANLQGRHDGICTIGDNVWIGPQSFLDARALVIEEHVGLGPGVRLLGSTHTGKPLDVPIIQTDLEIKPIRIGAWADIGTGATILPGVSIGKGAIVGAGAVVTADVEPFSIAAGVPAKFVRWRDERQPGSERH